MSSNSAATDSSGDDTDGQLYSANIGDVPQQEEEREILRQRDIYMKHNRTKIIKNTVNELNNNTLGEAKYSHFFKNLTIPESVTSLTAIDDISDIEWFEAVVQFLIETVNSQIGYDGRIRFLDSQLISQKSFRNLYKIIFLIPPAVGYTASTDSPSPLTSSKNKLTKLFGDKLGPEDCSTQLNGEQYFLPQINRLENAINQRLKTFDDFQLWRGVLEGCLKILVTGSSDLILNYNPGSESILRLNFHITALKPVSKFIGYVFGAAYKQVPRQLKFNYSNLSKKRFLSKEVKQLLASGFSATNEGQSTGTLEPDNMIGDSNGNIKLIVEHKSPSIAKRLSGDNGLSDDTFKEFLVQLYSYCLVAELNTGLLNDGGHTLFIRFGTTSFKLAEASECKEGQDVVKQELQGKIESYLFNDKYVYKTATPSFHQRMNSKFIIGTMLHKAIMRDQAQRDTIEKRKIKDQELKPLIIQMKFDPVSMLSKTRSHGKVRKLDLYIAAMSYDGKAHKRSKPSSV